MTSDQLIIFATLLLCQDLTFLESFLFNVQFIWYINGLEYTVTTHPQKIFN